MEYKRGQIRSMAQYDRGIWDWSILDGCFGNTKISPTDIDGCIERRGHKLFIETKLPGVKLPFGQELTLYSLVNDGHTVLVVWGENDTPQRMKIITPFEDGEEKPTDLEGFRSVVRNWFRMAEDTANNHQVEPARMARAFWRRRGKAYCDIMMAQWAKLDEADKRRIDIPLE